MGLGRSQATELHGAYCGGHGTPFCPKDRRITTTPFEFKMPKVIAARPLLARRSSAESAADSRAIGVDGAPRAGSGRAFC